MNEMQEKTVAFLLWVKDLPDPQTREVAIYLKRFVMGYEEGLGEELPEEP